MLKRTPLFLVVIFAAAICLMPQPASAWNNTGHKTVAFIAWQKLAPQTKVRVLELLKLHPDYNTWVNGLSNNIDIRGPIALMNAAVWPDLIKEKNNFFDDKLDNQCQPNHQPPGQGFADLEKHRFWHFINIVFSSDGTPVKEPCHPNAVDKITEFAGALGNPAVAKPLQSYDLTWLVHLVGDVHQPLHSVARFTMKETRGDAGGNGFLIQDPTHNLHSFWDDLLGQDDTPPTIAALAREIMNSEKREEPDQLNPDFWVGESAVLAKYIVYKIGEDEPQQPPPVVLPQYRSVATEIARHRVAVAGYRLADVLNMRLK